MTNEKTDSRQVQSLVVTTTSSDQGRDAAVAGRCHAGQAAAAQPAVLSPKSKSADRPMPKVLLNHSFAHRLAEKHLGRIGMMLSPSRTRPTRDLPVAIDNGCYSAWKNKTEWDADDFFHMLQTLECTTEWAVVPDVVGDAEATFRLWDEWAPQMESDGFTLALAVQDGMTPELVRKYTAPEVIFVGGTKRWKRRTMWNWCREFPRVHIGRVNYGRWLWEAHRAGAESSDGNGWFRGDQRQTRGLLHYLMRSDRGLDEAQLELEFAKTFDLGERTAGEARQL